MTNSDWNITKLREVNPKIMSPVTTMSQQERSLDTALGHSFKKKKIDICKHVLFLLFLSVWEDKRFSLSVFLFLCLCFVLPHIVTFLWDKMWLFVIFFSVYSRDIQTFYNRLAALSYVVLYLKPNKNKTNDTNTKSVASRYVKYMILFLAQCLFLNQ